MEDSSAGTADEASEYGSDFTADEEDILNGLLQGPSMLEVVDNPIIFPELQSEDVENEAGAHGVKIPIWFQYAGSSKQKSGSVANQQLDILTELPANVESDLSRTGRESSVSIEAPVDPSPGVPDLRSPLQRFRTKPQKALSVTDLVSPSWCELQYWYALTKHGRKRRTPAMRQGFKVHKELEDQVHTTVQVDVQSKEDRMGLRIWNVIQGLRTLRVTGMTRELAVWGLLDGHVVNGVIDQLTYTCPDPELEATADEQRNAKGKKTSAIPPDQATITEFLNPVGTLESTGGSLANALRSSQATHGSAELRSRIYIADVKTRGVRSLPKGASFRPTLMQLLLYHRLLAELASGDVDSELLFQRFDVDPNLSFTDGFIAQMANLNQGDEPAEAMELPTEGSVPVSSQDCMTTLLTHNSLNALWGLMIEEFKATLPLGAKSLGSVLKAEYRDSSTGEIMGSKTILYDHETLDRYLKDAMVWWRGERSARGVSVEEAYKCGSCEFAEGCEWRANKVDDHVKSMRSRSKV